MLCLGASRGIIGIKSTDSSNAGNIGRYSIIAGAVLLSNRAVLNCVARLLRYSRAAGPVLLARAVA